MTSGRVVFVRQELEQGIREVIKSITVAPDENGNVTAISSNGLPTIIDAAITSWPQAMPVYNAASRTVKFSSSVDGGAPQEIALKLVDGQPPLTFQDKNQETFKVDGQGKVTYMGRVSPTQFLGSGASTNFTIDTSRGTVAFAPDSGQRYGLDGYDTALAAKSKTYAADYLPLNDGDDSHRAGWKSMESGQFDKVRAILTITDPKLDPKKLAFVTGRGDTLGSTLQNGNTYTIGLAGALPGNSSEIYAVYPPDKGTAKGAGGTYMGRLNIYSYAKLSKKLVVVPVNDAGTGIDATALEGGLNRIYQQAVAGWKVELAGNFKTDAGFDNLESGNSSSMSAYTDAQKRLAKAYRDAGNPMDDGTYYIFVVRALSNGDAGYMVRGGQVGFVSSTDVRTIAHELGHGAYRLQHTWDQYGLERGSTNNLMDYASGTELWYGQWRYMRSPDVIFRPLEGDDEGAGSALAVQDVFLPYASNDTITLSSGTKIVFNNGVKWKQSGNNYIITYQGKEIAYKAFKNSITNEFIGFYPIDKLTDSTINNGIKIYDKLAKANYLDKGLYKVIYQYKQEHTKAFFKLIAQRKDITKEQAEQIALLFEAMSPALFKVFEAQTNASSDNCRYINLNIPGIDYSKCWQPLIETLKRFFNGTEKLNAEIIALVKSEKVDKAIVNEKFSQLRPNNYLGFSASEKQWLLSYLACGNLTSLNSKEEYALRLIENTEETEADGLISVLKAKPINLNDKQLKAEYSERILLYTIDKNIDGDNYKRLAVALKNLLLKSSNIEKSLGEVTTNLQDRMFVLGVGGQQNFAGQITLADVSWTDRDKLSIVRQETINSEKQVYVPMGSMVGGYYTTQPFSFTNKLPAIELDPFAMVALINFTNNSEILNAIEMGREPSEGGTIIYAPACFLKFADKKLTNEAVKNGIITSGYIALDVLTIVKGVPAFSTIRAATLAGEISKELAFAKYAYKALEIGNAIGNIKLNLTSPQLQDTTFREVVEASNYLLLALNAKDIAKGTANGLYAVYGVTKQALQNGKNLIKKQILARFVAAIIDNEAKLYALRRQANLGAQVALELDQLAAVKQAVEKEAKVAYGEADWQEAVNSARKGVNRARREFNLLAEEALGGHSIARHGSQLTLLEMEQRVLGTHPTIPQSRSALRFETQAIHEDAVNKAFTQYGDEIDAFFAIPNNTYKEWTFDYGSKVGSGYTNTGTLNNPVSQAVTSNKVTISIKRVANSLRGYRLESAFPDVR